MSSICHHFFCHHKYTPYAHFCRFRFPFTSPLSLCTRKPHFTILNLFASARVNRPGTGTTKYGFSHSKPTPFRRYNFREDRRTPSADAPSAQRESIRVSPRIPSCYLMQSHMTMLRKISSHSITTSQSGKNSIVVQHYVIIKM